MTRESEEKFPSFYAQSQMNYKSLLNWSRQDKKGCGLYEMASAWLLDSLALQSYHREINGKYGERKGIHLFG